jgi:hypothetical protein
MELFHATLNLAQYGPLAAAVAAATVAAATAAAVEAAVEVAVAAVAVETVTVTLIEIIMKDGGIIKPLRYLKRAAGL